MTFPEIIQAFAEGKSVVSFKTPQPQRDRKHLYYMARRNGHLWLFATLPGELFIKA